MATNLDIDQEVLIEAVQLGQHRSKRAAVEQALKEYVARHKQAEVIELFGTIEYDENFDYKKQRRKS